MNLTKIVQISVRAKNLPRATEFYRDTLGLKLIISTPVVSIVDCGGITLLLGAAESPEFDHPSSIIYFDADDIQEAVKLLSSRGVKIEDKPHVVGQLGDQEIWVAIFRDSEDNFMGLMSRVMRNQKR